jgi:hypothetical protein
MSGGGTTTTTNVSKTELPEWVNTAGKANYDTAVQIGNRPLQQFQGSTVADLSPTMRQALEFSRTGATTPNPYTAQAGGVFSRMGDPTAMNANIGAYMNPETANVENKALGALNDQRIQSLMGNADSAVKSRAFGGSRSAIIDAVTNSEAAKGAGVLSAGLRKSAFDNATQRQFQDMSTSGQGLLSTGDQYSNNFIKSLTALTQGGQIEQANAQGQLDDRVAKFNEVRDKDTNALNLRMSALGMTPYNTSSSSTGTTKAPSTFDPAALIMGMLKLGMGFA